MARLKELDDAKQIAVYLAQETIDNIDALCKLREGFCGRNKIIREMIEHALTLKRFRLPKVRDGRRSSGQ